MNLVPKDLTLGPQWVKIVRSPLEHAQWLKGQPTISGPEEAVKFLRDVAMQEEVEVLYGVALDPSSRVLGFWEAARGSEITVAAPMKSLFRPAIALEATHMLFAHNHPSGEARASEDDYKVYLTAFEASKYVDVELLDAFVLAGDEATSLGNTIRTTPEGKRALRWASARWTEASLRALRVAAS
jgi:DNA repair protein RadC